MATYLVRDGGTGASPTTSWAGAYDDITTALAAASRGDTIFVADGSYSAFTFNETVSSTTLVTVKKATAGDHFTETGWNSTYGDGQAVFGGDCFINTGYFVFDGQVGGGPDTWTSGHGFKCTTVQVLAADFDPTTPIPGGNVVIRHVETEGTLTPGNSDAFSFASCDGWEVSYCWTHDTDNCPLNSFLSPNGIFQYNCTQEFASSGEFHAEIAFIYGNGNLDIRYNLFRWAESTGGLMINNPNGEPVRIYGNVFYRAAGETWAYGGDGLVGGWSNRADLSIHDVSVINNTFIGIDDVNTGGNCAAVIGTTPHSDLVWKNNLFYECLDGTGLPNGVWDADYDHYVDSGSESETNGTTATGNPFINYTGLNFGLSSNTTSGENLGSPFNTDMYGMTRTTWTRGAIEFGSSEPTKNITFSGTLTVTTLTVG